MEESLGVIKSTKNGGNEGVITEEGSGANLEFINPAIPNPPVGERFAFLKIIQNTPNGSKVVNILKGRLPV
jgi:hypothetical protein